ncbi:terminase [Neobacillus sp. MM2021_6]|uniref:terminase n=1 Tax=Bacillaceae TaxID=186817 RepID=UPI001409B39F|nr:MULTISPECIES: terminase [Bacillaceae]MBO0961452.1 terminase [Neobacillus sp. MM2021_6]NHC19557.1 terminase [Bacillus sp. MM2020_4]
MKKVELDELRIQLLSRIDTEDLLEIKKVNDLIRLHELDAECDEVIDRDGVSIVVENGSQKFIKSHPSMNEKMKINAQKIALEKSIKFKLKTAPAPASTTVEGNLKRGSLL